MNDFEKGIEHNPKLSRNPVIAGSEAEAARLREILPEGVPIKVDRVGMHIDTIGLAGGIEEPGVQRLKSVDGPLLPPRMLNPESGELNAEIEARARQARDAGPNPNQGI